MIGAGEKRPGALELAKAYAVAHQAWLDAEAAVGRRHRELTAAMDDEKRARKVLDEAATALEAHVAAFRARIGT